MIYGRLTEEGGIPIETLDGKTAEWGNGGPMINDLVRLTRSDMWKRVFHPWRENELMRIRLMNLSIENEELSRENREFKKGLGKDRMVMEIQGNAQYWCHRWSILYNFFRDRCPNCKDAPSDDING